MPYTIRTRDGIVLANIPDDIKPDDERLKQLVGQRRTERRSSQREAGIARLKAENPAEYDPASPEFRAKSGPTAGMNRAERVAANIGAGATNFGVGLGQALLPKSAEASLLGITDESIDDKRALDEELAQSTTGGRLLQVAGEAAPGFLVPGGAIARGLGQAGKAGAWLARRGVGTRALPTLTAEGAVLGATEGAITPTRSDESALANAVAGGLGGAIFPSVVSGAGALVRPLVPGLRQRAVASKLGEALDTSPAATQRLERGIRQSAARVVDAPQSTATLLQDPKLAQMELAARAHPDSAAGWAQADEIGRNAKWKALDEALGNEGSVGAARAATDAYARDAIPEVFKAVRGKQLSSGLDDLRTAVAGRLSQAVKEADPARQEVYGYVAKALSDGGNSPRMLWNIRKTLSSWLEGRPPPGKEGTRGAKMDAPIMETRKAIDEVLNRATAKRWTKFLERYGEHAQREAAEKAGQNIRNAFFDETLSTPRGATTAAGNPAVTRARLEQALLKHGKNEFGETLNFKQRNVIDQVLTDLRAEEILQRAKSSMTGGGGSQTAPLMALLRRGPGLTNGLLTDLANAFASFAQGKQRTLLNEILQSPQDALVLLRQAEKIKRPLSNSEKLLVQAARSVFLAPAAVVAANGPVEASAQQVRQ